MNNYANHTNRKVKVCFLIPGMDAGGIENYLLRFLQFQVNKNWSCTVIARSARIGDLSAEYEKLNVKIKYQEVSFANPLKWYRLYQHFKNESYDTICDFNGNFGGIPMLVGKLAGVNNRITFYRRSSRAYKLTALKLFYDNYLNKLVNRFSTRILSNSKHALDIFFKDWTNGNGQFKIIPNGINLENFITTYSKEEARVRLDINPDAYVIGHVGRFDPSKNHEMIFKVARKLIKEMPNVQFLFCGKGTDSGEFIKTAEKYGIENHCVFLGLQDNIPMVLKAMDLFYFPSVTEGQPNALIEAMVMGIPILASRIPPICEIIPENAHDHILIDPENVSQSVKKITDIYNTVLEPVNLEAFVKKNFNGNTNFKLFENEL